ncbi:MAG: ADP-ribosylglycohydrolase family protein [Sedimentitalea sp.]
MSRRGALMMGALVSDAASLGVHWIYDVARIGEIRDRHGSTAFVPYDPAHFADVPAYDAHPGRPFGAQSQYGETLMLAMTHMAQTGRFDVSGYSAAYSAHFGAGGPYNGYIDRPTRGTLANLTAETSPSGVDDDQLPALSTLPALVGYPSADQMRAVQVTNVNSEAEIYASVVAHLFSSVTDGTDVHDALRAAANTAPDPAKSLLLGALDSDITDSVAYGEITKRACHLNMGVPLAFHILTHAPTYRDAIEANTSAGGDSAGRSLLIGAVMGAVHGVGTPTGVPVEWLLNLADARTTWARCAEVARLPTEG